MRTLTLSLVVLAGAAGAHADDWNNPGGTPGRNGRSMELGPDGADLLWNTGRSSIIAWAPVIEGRRVYMVRQTGFPPEPALGTSSTIVCQDLDTGAEIWTRNIPFESGDWTTWVGGVKNGRVYASRGGNGASSAATLYCFDAGTGAQLWRSTEEIDAGSYDGMTFAPNGDPIVGSFRFVWRFDALSGAVLWRVPRTCSVSGNCGAAANGSGIFIADTVAGGQTIRKLDLGTGAELYRSPVMSGFLVQNSPMVGPDGTVYFHRVQNNALVDFFYAWQDTGASLAAKWNTPAGYTTSCELAVGPDGTVYTWAPGNVVVRLDPGTGMILNTSPVIPADFATIRIATDRDGRVFLSNGAFSNGRMYSFEADLTLRWSAPIANINIGAPAMGPDGTLVVAGVGTNVRAYRTERSCGADLSGSSDPNDPAYGVPDGAADSADFFYYLDQFVADNLAVADLTGSSDPNDPAYGTPDGLIDAADFFFFLDLFVLGC